MTEVDRSRSDHRSDDHLVSFANWMMQSKCHHSLSETDPDSADSADAVAALASLLDVTVADAEQESAERLVDSPIQLDLCFDIEVEMCQTRKEIRCWDDVARLAYLRLSQVCERTGV